MTRASTAARRMPRFPHQVIRASAGTGKTYQLSGRYLALAAAGQPLDEILATTFARKAAGEILERVLLRVAEAVDDPAARQALAQHVGAARLAQPRACQELLARLVRQLHRLRVGTLDSFFVQLGGHFSLDLGLPPGWSIVDELEDAQLRSEAIRRLFARSRLTDRDGATDLRTLLHLLSKGAVTRSLTEQVRDTVKGLYTIWRESDPEAWRRLQRRRELSDEELAAAVAGLKGRQLSEQLAAARDADLARFETGDWKKYLQTGIAAKLAQGATTYNRKKIDRQLAEAYRPLVQHASAKLINALVDQTVATARLLEHFHEEYWRLKLSRRALRFEDVTWRLAAALAGGELAAVGFRLDADVRHLLLDEFQDTSLAQWGVLQPFGEAVTRQPGGSFFCVGDSKQAIYGWRGGVAEIFDLVDQQLPGLDRQTLATSYRSSPVIIDVVNRVFGTLASNEDLADTPAVRVNWSRQFTRHATAKTDLPGYACLEIAPHPVGDEKVDVATLRYTAAVVARWSSECPGRSIGVLVRTNKAIARLIYELRAHHSVLASEEGGNPLVDSVAVQTVLSLLRLADHPGDTTARFHVATSPLGVAVGFTAFRDDEGARQLSRVVREELLERGYGPVLYDWARRLAPSCDERQLRRLLQLVEQGYAYEPQATLRADDFVRLVEMQKVEDPTAASVRVMTVHQAKGLEFDIVVLPELDYRLRGQTPPVVVGREGALGPVKLVSRYAAKEIAALLPAEFRQLFERWPSEETHAALCLLYVAMTRAVHALHMIACDPSLPSRCSKTPAALVRRALAPDAAPQELPAVIFETGDRDWHRAAGGAATDLAGGDARAAPQVDEPPPLRLRAAERMRNVERRSPSRLAGSAARPLADVLRPLNREATARGSLQHAWYEAIGWLEDGLPADGTLRAIAQRGTLAGLDVEAELRAFHAALGLPAIRDALSRRAYESPDSLGLPPAVCAELSAAPCELVLEREWGFLLDEDNSLLQGAIDRLVVWRRNDRALWADVIDFKTNVVREAAAEDQLVEHYRPQLDAYRRAVSRAFDLPLERTSARIVLVSRGSVRSV